MIASAFPERIRLLLAELAWDLSARGLKFLKGFAVAAREGSRSGGLHEKRAIRLATEKAIPFGATHKIREASSLARIFKIGAILYQMLTLRLPVEGRNMV